MVKKTPSKATVKVEVATIGTEGEIFDLMPKIMLFPCEDETTYLGLRQAFMTDLVPGTPYETVIAENLVTLEWEAIRHRQMRDDLIRLEYRNYAADTFMRQQGENIVFGVSTEAIAFATALMGPDPAPRAKSLKRLERYDIEESEILAKAYEAAVKSVEIHERKLADIEFRRRRLREDYDRLKATRARPVIEPEVVDAIVLDEV